MTYSSVVIQENAHRQVIYPGRDAQGNLEIADAAEVEGLPTTPERTNAQTDYSLRVPASSSSDEPSWVEGGGGGGLSRTLVATSDQVASGVSGAPYYNWTISSNSYLQTVTNSNSIRPLLVQPATAPVYWFEVIRSSNNAILASGWVPPHGGSGGVQEPAFYPVPGGEIRLRIGVASTLRPYYIQFRQSTNGISNASRVRIYAIPLLPS